MADPEIAIKKPCVMELEPGKSYWWCACGKSKKQPFCDGSHQGGEFVPMEVKVEERKNYAFCQCKRTANNPWCDGTHGEL